MSESFTPGQTAALADQLARQGAGDLSQALALTSDSPETAKRILQGMELKTNKDFLPSGEDAAEMDRHIAAALGGLFHTRPGSFGGDSPIRNLPFIPNPDIGKIVAINLPARTGPWSYRDEDLVMELPYRPGQVYPGSASALEDAIKSVYAAASSDSRDTTGRLNAMRLTTSIAMATGGQGAENGEEVAQPDAAPTQGEEALKQQAQGDSESNNRASPESNRTREEGGYANDADPGYGSGDVVAAAATKSPTKANAPTKSPAKTNTAGGAAPPVYPIQKFTQPITDKKGRTISADELNQATAVVYAEMTGSDNINQGKTFTRRHETAAADVETPMTKLGQVGEAQGSIRVRLV